MYTFVHVYTPFTFTCTACTYMYVNVHTWKFLNVYANENFGMSCCLLFKIYWGQGYGYHTCLYTKHTVVTVRTYMYMYVHVLCRSTCTCIHWGSHSQSVFYMYVQRFMWVTKILTAYTCSYRMRIECLDGQQPESSVYVHIHVHVHVPFTNARLS